MRASRSILAALLATLLALAMLATAAHVHVDAEVAGDACMLCHAARTMVAVAVAALQLVVFTSFGDVEPPRLAAVRSAAAPLLLRVRGPPSAC